MLRAGPAVVVVWILLPLGCTSEASRGREAERGGGGANRTAGPRLPCASLPPIRRYPLRFFPMTTMGLWTPGARSSPGYGCVYLLPPGSSARRAIWKAPGPSGIRGPVRAPDGRSFVVGHRARGSWRVYRIAVSGRVISRVVGRDVAFISDGRLAPLRDDEIVFEREEGRFPACDVIRSATAACRLPCEVRQRDGQRAWSRTCLSIQWSEVNVSIAARSSSSTLTAASSGRRRCTRASRTCPDLHPGGPMESSWRFPGSAGLVKGSAADTFIVLLSGTNAVTAQQRVAFTRTSTPSPGHRQEMSPSPTVGRSPVARAK